MKKFVFENRSGIVRPDVKPLGGRNTMLGFWETKMRDHKLLVYSYVPIFCQSGLLMLAASGLWHSWSKRRRDELKSIAQKLQQNTGQMRGNAFSWGYATLMNEDGLGITVPLISRNIGKLELARNPDAVPYLVSAALKLLFITYPVLEEMRKKESEYRHIFEGVRGIIETLMEAPYCGSHPEISKEALVSLGKSAIFLECENLCFYQANLEDRFYREGNSDKKRKIIFPEEEIEGLAEQLGIPYKLFWKDFKGTCSPWWWIKAHFHDAATREKALFVSGLGCQEIQQESIMKAFKFGSPFSDESPRCWREECIPRSEAVIKAFIAVFLSKMNGKSFDPSLLLQEAGKK